MKHTALYSDDPDYCKPGTNRDLPLGAALTRRSFTVPALPWHTIDRSPIAVADIAEATIDPQPIDSESLPLDQPSLTSSQQGMDRNYVTEPNPDFFSGKAAHPLRVRRNTEDLVWCDTCEDLV